MRRRDLSTVLLASATASALSNRPASATANTSSPALSESRATPEEAAAGIVPVNFGVFPPFPERYGAKGDGVTNDQIPLEQCIAANNGVRLSPGKKYLVNGLTINKVAAVIQGSGGAGFIIANGRGNFGLRFQSPAGKGTHFNSGFVGRDFWITCQSGSERVLGIWADNAEIAFLECVNVSLSGNHYSGTSVGDGSIAFFGFFQQDGVFIKCNFTGGGGEFADGLHLTGNLKANQTPNNNYYLACRAQSCGGYGVRLRLGDGNIWRGGKIQANRGGGWMEGDDGEGNGPSNTVIAEMGFEANSNEDLTISVSGQTRVFDCTFQSTAVKYHIHETRYARQGHFLRNVTTSGKPVLFAGTGSDNVWDYNNGFGAITANEDSFAAAANQIVDVDPSSSAPIDASKGYHFVIAANTASVVTISNPANPKLGQIYTWDIVNTSGGTMGEVKFGAQFLMEGAFTSPAKGHRRTITFRRTQTGYVELSRNSADLG